MTVFRRLITFIGFEYEDQKADKADSDFRNLARGAARLAAVVGGAAAAIQNLQQAYGRTAELERFQSITGASVEALSELRFIAESAGVRSQEAFEGIVEIGERASDVVRNIGKLTGDAGESFKALGFRSVEDLKGMNGELRTGEDLFFDALRRLSQVENQADRTGVAMRLFGDDVGTRLARVAALGADEIERLRQEARDLGIVLDGESLRAMQEFRAVSARTGAVMRALRDEIGLNFLQALGPAIKAIGDFVRENRELIRSGSEKAIMLLTAALQVGLPLLLWLLQIFVQLPALVQRFRAQLEFLALAFGSFLLAKFAADLANIAYFMRVILVSAVQRGTAALLAQARAWVALRLAYAKTALPLLAVALLVEDLVRTIQGGDTFFSRLAAHLRRWSEGSNLFARGLRILIDLIDSLAIGLAAAFESFQNGTFWQDWLAGARSALSQLLNLINQIPGVSTFLRVTGEAAARSGTLLSGPQSPLATPTTDARNQSRTTSVNVTVTPQPGESPFAVGRGIGSGVLDGAELGVS